MLVRQWRERERDEQTLVERVESELKSLTLVDFSVQVGFEELDLTHSLPKLLIPFQIQSNPIQSEQLELLRFILSFKTIPFPESEIHTYLVDLVQAPQQGLHFFIVSSAASHPIPLPYFFFFFFPLPLSIFVSSSFSYSHSVA